MSGTERRQNLKKIFLVLSLFVKTNFDEFAKIQKMARLHINSKDMTGNNSNCTEFVRILSERAVTHVYDTCVTALSDRL